MRNLKYLAVCAIIAAGASSLLVPARAQTSSPADIKATADAIATIVAQQKILADNQGKIDAKLATIAENVRVARLYAARVK